MTMWSDNRNHLLDDLLRDVILVTVAQLIGVAPGQFIAIVAITQLSESFQHANVRLWFGQVGERLWISPGFTAGTTASALATRRSSLRPRQHRAKQQRRRVWYSAGTTSGCFYLGGTC